MHLCPCHRIDNSSLSILIGIHGENLIGDHVMIQAAHVGERARMLDELGTDAWGDLFSRFSNLRKPHAEAIADITSSGATLRDNHLRILEDGLILQSQAVLARNVADDSMVMTRDSRGMIHATSVMAFQPAKLSARNCAAARESRRGSPRGGRPRRR